MKKTIISLATASLIASSAMAADKGIDFTTTGQAVVYYQTSDAAGNGDLFDQKTSSANVGIQLNSAANLGNGFTLGSQLSYLGTAGLEKNLVSGTRQGVTDVPAGLGGGSTTDNLALTKIFVAKTIANTTVKMGRQELPKSLSPLAFSEGWNVFKNTFDAILVINSDIPNTTLVGAYVSGGTNMSLTSTQNLTAVTNAAAANVAGTAYMITAQNTSLPMTTVTGSYYNLSKVGENIVAGSYIAADAVWLDAKIADKSLPMGLKIGLQAGSIMPDSELGTVPMDSTTAFGVKASIKAMDALTVCGAFTNVSGNKDGEVQVAIKNTGTGIKTPLYTQMVANQNAIALDNSTFMLKGAYSLGDMGTVIAQGTYTQAGSINLNNTTAEGNDFTDLELLYKVKAGGVNFLAALVNVKKDQDDDATNIVRVWARYAF